MKILYFWIFLYWKSNIRLLQLTETFLTSISPGSTRVSERALLENVSMFSISSMNNVSPKTFFSSLFLNIDGQFIHHIVRRKMCMCTRLQ